MLLWAPVVLLQAPSSVAQALFDRPPTRVMIHNPEATECLRNRTTITVVVPGDAGNALGTIVLRQLPNLDQWDWGRLEPWVYFGDYSLRGKGARGLARAVVSGPEEDLSIEFNPAIEPGHTVNVVSVASILSPVFINGPKNSWRMVRTPSVISAPPCV